MAAILGWFYDLFASWGLFMKEAKVLFLGLDSAGKTTLLHVLKHGSVMAHEPTTHAGKEEVIVGSLKIEAHDLGGHKGARRGWDRFFTEVDGVVFIVDSADRERLTEAATVLGEVLDPRNEKLKETPVLVLGNKIDKAGACTEDELKASLNLMHTTGKDDAGLADGVRPLEIFMCTVTGQAGFKEGFDWLATHIE